MLLLRPKVGCFILSLLIPNTEIRKLEYNNKIVKFAYFNGQKVYTHRYTVNFFNNEGELISTQYVEHGADAKEPSNPIANSPFYSYTFTGWNTDFTNVTSDINVTALAITNGIFIFANGQGLNPNYELNNDAIFTICNNSPYKNYAEAIDSSKISCVSTAKNDDGGSNTTNPYPGKGYMSSTMFIPLDCDALQKVGITKLTINGSYSIVTSESGYSVAAASTTNARGVFYGLFSEANVNISTSGVTNANYIKQVHKRITTLNSGSNYGYADDIDTTSLNHIFTLPTSGIYYLIIGSYLFSTRAIATLDVSNIYLD